MSLYSLILAGIILLSTPIASAAAQAQPQPSYDQQGLSLLPFTAAIPNTAYLSDTLPSATAPGTLAPDPTDGPSLVGAYDLKFELLKRQNTYCALGYTNCGYLNAANVCCQTNALCTNDGAGRVACCPQGAVCTGVASGGTAATAVVGVGLTASTVGAFTGFVQGNVGSATSAGSATTSTQAGGGIVVVSGNGNAGGQTSSNGGSIGMPFGFLREVSRGVVRWVVGN